MVYSIPYPRNLQISQSKHHEGVAPLGNEDPDNDPAIGNLDETTMGSQKSAKAKKNKNPQGKKSG